MALLVGILLLDTGVATVAFPAGGSRSRLQLDRWWFRYHVEFEFENVTMDVDGNFTIKFNVTNTSFSDSPVVITGLWLNGIEWGDLNDVISENITGTTLPGTLILEEEAGEVMHHVTRIPENARVCHGEIRLKRGDTWTLGMSIQLHIRWEVNGHTPIVAYTITMPGPSEPTPESSLTAEARPLSELAP